MSSPKRFSFKQLPHRLHEYQKERHPLWIALLMAGAISYTGVTLSALSAHRPTPGLLTYLAAMGLLLCFHLQRRVADDLRNVKYDRTHHVNRPIPRGLVSPNELRILFAAMIPVEALFCILIDVRLLGPLLVTNGFLMILTVGIGPLRWDTLHPLFALCLHRLAAPATLHCVIATEWLPHQISPPPYIYLLLLLSLLNSFTLEIGRNFTLPDARDPDGTRCRSYALLWGPRKAALIWWLLINLSAIHASILRIARGGSAEGMIALLAGILLTGIFAYRAAATLQPAAARHLNPASSLWTLILFLSIAVG